MATSPVLGLPFLAESQGSPHITHNEAVILLQAISMGAIEVGLNTPPSGSPGPQDGDMYVTGPSPTGDWAGWPDRIAILLEGQWQFVPGRDSDGTIITMDSTQEGLRVWDNENNDLKVWADSDGSPGEYSWRPFDQLSIDTGSFIKQYARNLSNAANSTSCTASVDTVLPLVGDGAVNFPWPNIVTGKVSFDDTYLGSGSGAFKVENLSQYTMFLVRITVVNLDASQTTAEVKAHLVASTSPADDVQIVHPRLTLTQNIEAAAEVSFFHGGIDAIYVEINCANTRNIRLRGVLIEARELQTA